MLVGVMSDTHGRFLAARQAVALFDRLGVGHIVHCGDVGDADVFGELVGHPLTFVWGNTDTPHAGLLGFLNSVGFTPPTRIPARVELGGKRFAVFHGHERQFQACAKLDVDYVLYGHTHESDVQVIDGKKLINPGALHRANPRTVATIDTEADEVRFHEISNA